MEEGHHALGGSVHLLHHDMTTVLDERLASLDSATADPGSASQLLGLLAGALQNACAGRISDEYVGGQQAAMQDCVKLVGGMVTWMAQGAALTVASAAPATCTSLKDFIAAALDLASHAFFSPHWYEQLGPGSYVAAGNAVRGFIKDLALVAMDATEACWRAVEQQLATGDPGGQELLGACRALFGALFEGLRHLGMTSAERINDPAVPREMRSFAGLNILWTGLSRVMTGLPQEAMQQLLSGPAVQSVIRALLGYLLAEVRVMPASGPGDYETRLKVSRFWLQHAARVAQVHVAAAAACWDELTTTAAEVYGHVAGCGAASAAPSASPQQAAMQGQASKDMEAGVAVKLASLLAVVLDAAEREQRVGGCGEPAAGSADAGRGGGQPASSQQIEARLAKLESLAQQGGVAAAAATASPSVACPPPCAGAVMLGLALLQRAVHVSPEARAALAARTLPWAGYCTAVHLYGMALDGRGPAAVAVAPCLDVPHQLAAAALALLAACADGQGHGHGAEQDVDTFAAACAIVCNWGACSHPLLSTAAADVLSTLVGHCEAALASRLVAAVARLAGLAAAAEAAAGAATGAAAAGGGMSGRVEVPAVGRRLERLLGCMLAAASPQTEPAWRAVLEQQLHVSATYGTGAGPDLCGAATARVLWGATAAASSAQAAAARVPGAGPVLPPVSVSEQELGSRARQLLAAMRQAVTVLTALGTATATSAGVAASAPAAASALLRPWLAQLLGCLEATVVHIRTTASPALQLLLPEVGAAVAELLQALSPEAQSGAPVPTSQGPAACAPPVHAAVRLLARTAESLPQQTLVTLAPALTRLAEAGSPALAADAAVVAAFCNSPPPEALYQALLRSPHAMVVHAALQSQVALCRTVPQQYAPAVRRLFPPDPAGGPGPPAHLAALFKSYMARRVGDGEEVTAPAVAGRARAAEGARLEGAAREGCVPNAALGRPVAAPELQRAVQQGVEAMQACMATLSLAAAAAASGDGDTDPMVTDNVAAAARQGHTIGGGPSGPLKPLIADDHAAMGGVASALGGLERGLGALHAAVRAHGINPSRQSAEWDQLQAHARAMLGDLSSATSRIRTMNDMLHTLQGR